MIPVLKPERIISAYGIERDIKPFGKHIHDGVDMVSRNNDPTLFAMLDGVVIDDRDDYNDALRWKDKHHSVGNRIVVQSKFKGETVFWSYYHMEENICSKDEEIFKGQVVGTYGNVGMSYGSHVHVIAWDKNWKVIDPKPLLEA